MKGYIRMDHSIRERNRFMLSTTHFLLAFIPFLVISCTIHYVYKKVRTSGNSSNIYYVKNDLPNDFINEKQEKCK